MQIGTSTHDKIWCTDSTFMQTALTYANEVEAVSVSSSRFQTIKAPCISHTTIIHQHASTENTTLHYKLIPEHCMSEYCTSHATDRFKNKV